MGIDQHNNAVLISKTVGELRAFLQWSVTRQSTFSSHANTLPGTKKGSSSENETALLGMVASV
jgi:hypothetical protein